MTEVGEDQTRFQHHPRFNNIGFSGGSGKPGKPGTSGSGGIPGMPDNLPPGMPRPPSQGGSGKPGGGGKPAPSHPEEDDQSSASDYTDSQDSSSGRLLRLVETDREAREDLEACRLDLQKCLEHPLPELICPQVAENQTRFQHHPRFNNIGFSGGSGKPGKPGTSGSGGIPGMPDNLPPGMPRPPSQGGSGKPGGGGKPAPSGGGGSESEPLPPSLLALLDPEGDDQSSASDDTDSQDSSAGRLNPSIVSTIFGEASSKQMVPISIENNRLKAPPSRIYSRRIDHKFYCDDEDILVTMLLNTTRVHLRLALRALLDLLDLRTADLNVFTTQEHPLPESICPQVEADREAREDLEDLEACRLDLQKCLEHPLPELICPQVVENQTRFQHHPR
ncbi:unnamed protein product, partial [Darwinula stevensoni]